MLQRERSVCGGSQFGGQDFITESEVAICSLKVKDFESEYSEKHLKPKRHCFFSTSVWAQVSNSLSVKL